MFRKHNNTESFTVHEKDHSHYIRTVMKTCSNPNNIGFRNKDSLLIQTHCISKPSNAYSFQDRYTQRIIYFTYCLAPYFLNRLVTSYFFCQEVYFTFFFQKTQRSHAQNYLLLLWVYSVKLPFSTHTLSTFLLCLQKSLLIPQFIKHCRLFPREVFSMVSCKTATHTELGLSNQAPAPILQYYVQHTGSDYFFFF